VRAIFALWATLSMLTKPLGKTTSGLVELAAEQSGDSANG